MSKKIERIFEELPQIGRITGHINWIKGCVLLIPAQTVQARPSKIVLRHMACEDNYVWGEFKGRKPQAHSITYPIIIGKLGANPEPSQQEYLACVKHIPLIKEDKIYEIYTIAKGAIEEFEFMGSPISCVVDNRTPNESTKKCGKRLAKNISESLSHWKGNRYIVQKG